MSSGNSSAAMKQRLGSNRCEGGWGWAGGRCQLVAADAPLLALPTPPLPPCAPAATGMFFMERPFFNVDVTLKVGGWARARGGCRGWWRAGGGWVGGRAAHLLPLPGPPPPPNVWLLWCLGLWG